MANNILSKLFLIIVYLAIIIAIPVLLDLLLRSTTRSKRQNTLLRMAIDKAKLLNKSLVVFNGTDNGVIFDSANSWKPEEFQGEITEILGNMTDNCCVIMLLYSLEYSNNLPELLENIKRVGGNNFYIVGIEKNSPRTFWDPKLQQIMDKPYYTHENFSQIKWKEPNNLQKSLQNFYSRIFKMIPYDWTKHPGIKKIDS
jgi:hypothetical protein